MVEIDEQSIAAAAAVDEWWRWQILTRVNRFGIQAKLL